MGLIQVSSVAWGLEAEGKAKDYRGIRYKKEEEEEK